MLSFYQFGWLQPRWTFSMASFEPMCVHKAHMQTSTSNVGGKSCKSCVKVLAQIKFAGMRGWPLGMQAISATLSLLEPCPCHCLCLGQPQPRRSDLREFSAGKALAASACPRFTLWACQMMMTALLALNCLTEHEGWLQLAPAQGRASPARTTKIQGSSAMDFKLLGVAPHTTNSRNSLWFPLRAVTESFT